MGTPLPKHRHPASGAGTETAPLPRSPAVAARWGRGSKARRELAYWSGRFADEGGDLLAACDERLRLLYHNARFAEALGRARGAYLGMDLAAFFPSAHRDLVVSGLRELAAGPGGAVLDFESALLTAGDPLAIAGRARLALDSGRRQLLVAMRPAQDPPALSGEPRGDAASGACQLCGDLPLAVFRADRRLTIVQAAGELWSTFHIDPASLVGGSLVDPSCHLVPPFLQSIDYCDTMAGLTLQSDLSWHGRDYVLTVEPFIDLGMKVAGALGFLRIAKRIDSTRGAEHLSYPRPEDYTQAIKAPRAVSLSHGPPSKTAARHPPAPLPPQKPLAAPDRPPAGKAASAPRPRWGPAVAKSTSALPVAALDDQRDEAGARHADRQTAELPTGIRPRSLTFEDFREAMEGGGPGSENGDRADTRTREVSLPG